MSKNHSLKNNKNKNDKKQKQKIITHQPPNPFLLSSLSKIVEKIVAIFFSTFSLFPFPFFHFSTFQLFNFSTFHFFYKIAVFFLRHFS